MSNMSSMQITPDSAEDASVPPWRSFPSHGGPAAHFPGSRYGLDDVYWTCPLRPQGACRAPPACCHVLAAQVGHRGGWGGLVLLCNSAEM